MRKIMFVFLAVILLAGCSETIVQPYSRTVIVKDAFWRDVSIDNLQTDSRNLNLCAIDTYPCYSEVSESELLDYVEEYNAITLDDFLRVYYDTAPDLANAPPVDVFIVNPTTYAVNMAQYGIPRALLVENEAGWRADAHGQLLFIDHVPPPPLIEPPSSMYAWYALYVIDASGAIVYEDHCGWTVEEVWDGQWILDGGWTDADDYRADIRVAYVSEVVTHPGWSFVERQLYEAPGG